MKRDIWYGAAIGFLMGLFTLPVLKNVELAEKIPYFYWLIFLGLPVASAVGVAVSRWIGRRIPFIWQAAKFVLIGAFNTAIDFGILNVLIFATGYDKGLALAALNICSTSIAILNSYWWNSKWVFEGASKKQGREFLAFLAVTVIGIALNSATVLLITGFIAPFDGLTGEQWANLAKVLATAASLVWNFTGYKFIVFKKARSASA